MKVFSRYGEVLRPPGAAPALAASVVGRLSLGMTGLALLLLVREATGSYASAGLVSGCYAVAIAVGAPSRARAADRKGPSSVLRRGLRSNCRHRVADDRVIGCRSRGSPDCRRPG